MLIMYCGNWSEAPYQQRIDAKGFYQSGKIKINRKSFGPDDSSLFLLSLFSCTFQHSTIVIEP